MVMGIFFALLYVDNSFFVTYSTFAAYVGGLFLLFQIIMIIDLFYIWGEKWVKIYDEGNTCWGVVMIIFSVGLYVATGYLTFKNWTYFVDEPTCTDTTHRTILIGGIVLVVLLTGLTVSPVNDHKSVITSGAVSLYIAYLTFSGLTSSNIIECNPFFPNEPVTPVTPDTPDRMLEEDSGQSGSTKTLTLQIVVGMILYAIALLYVSYQTSENSSSKVKITGSIDLAA